MDVAELAPGLWRWTATHPARKPGDAWGADVACFYAETSESTVLVDPLVPVGAEREPFLRHLDEDVARRQGIPVAIVLTGEWHRRSTDELAERYGATVHIDGELPAGLERIGNAGPDPIVWLSELRALAVGDALISVGDELRLWGAAEDPEPLRAALDRPVEHVLVAHGEHVPGGRDALAAALARPPHG